MARILVTDGEHRACLAAVRSLGRAGHRVLVASPAPRPLAGASRFCEGTFVVRDPATVPAAYREDVRQVVDIAEVDVLLPITDVSASLLLPLREELPDLLIPFPDRDTYLAISDKRHLLEVAQRQGVPVPDQVVLECRGDVQRAISEFGATTPAVLKPARSVVVREEGVRKFSVRLLARADEAPAAIKNYPAEAYPILAQRRIIGPGLGAFLLTEAGRPLATFGHRRLREKPPTGGVSVYRESVPLRSDVRDYATRVLSAFGWTGAAMVEFKEDAATGTPYLMEVNGRLWGSLQLAVDAGVDFPRMMVDAALGRPIEGTAEPIAGVRSRWLWGDIHHLIWILAYGRRARASDPTLPSASRALGRFFIPWRPGDRLEVLRPSDPGPFARESAQWFRALWRGRSSKGA